MMKMGKCIFMAMALFLMLAWALPAQNYTDALLKSVQFFDANRCGPDVAAGNIFSWRGACHTQDGNDVGSDLTGGFHDAGDHVKFGLPQAYAASTLGWALYECKSEFDRAGATSKTLAILKIFTDYFLKSKVSGRFYYQIGEGEADHTYWGPPEEQTNDRPSYAWADSSKPASDVLGMTSAALSLMYLNYRGTNSSYASQCLSLARELYNMGKSSLGYGNGQSFYQSGSYYDDLSWAATWLYVIDGTASLLTDINNFLSNPNQYGNQPLVQNHWTMCWDDMGLAVLTKLAIVTGDSLYNSLVEENLNYWINTLTKTPGGLRYLHNWGVLRYAAAESMIAMLYYNYTGNTAYRTLAKSQLDYILGSNPANMSYIIGYGSNWALHPHHRAANGYTYANGDNQKPAQHELTGALVGGPDQSDKYIDDVNQYQYTEVAIDYNASLAAGLSAYLKFSSGTVTTPTPTPTRTVVTTTRTATRTSTITTTVTPGDVNGDSTINIVDALMTAQYSVGLNPAGFRTAAADTNCDGSINIVDALIIAQYSVGLVSRFC